MGTQTLKKLAEEYGGDMEYIELGVHQSNERALNLYKKLGYRIVATKEDLGFHIMRNPLQ